MNVQTENTLITYKITDIQLHSGLGIKRPDLPYFSEILQSINDGLDVDHEDYKECVRVRVDYSFSKDQVTDNGYFTFKLNDQECYCDGYEFFILQGFLSQYKYISSWSIRDDKHHSLHYLGIMVEKI